MSSSSEGDIWMCCMWWLNALLCACFQVWICSLCSTFCCCKNRLIAHYLQFSQFWRVLIKKNKTFLSLILFFLPFHFQRMWNLIKWEKSLLQPSTNMFFLRFHLWASEAVDTSAGWWTPLGEAGPLLRSWWVHILTIDNLLCSKLCGVTAFSSTLAVCTEPQSTQNTADPCVLDGSTVSSISGFSGNMDSRLCLNNWLIN